MLFFNLLALKVITRPSKEWQPAKREYIVCSQLFLIPPLFYFVGVKQSREHAKSEGGFFFSVKLYLFFVIT